MKVSAPEAGSSSGWTGLPEEVRQRAFDTTQERVQRILAVMGPKLIYAEPQNCALHMLQEPYEVRPSVTTLVGLSLCPECAVRAALEVSEHGLSQSELISRALSGYWI